jgi:hypothetical protein
VQHHSTSTSRSYLGLSEFETRIFRLSHGASFISSLNSLIRLYMFLVRDSQPLLKQVVLRMVTVDVQQ